MQACGRSSRRRTGWFQSASPTARHRRPRCRSACRGVYPRLARGHVRGRPENDPGLGGAAARSSATSSRSALDAAAESSAFARPKSNTFTVPSSRTLMLAGFKSRWMIPCSCAASSASAICFAIGSASSSEIAAACDAIRQSRRRRPAPSQALGDVLELFEAVDVRDVRMIERGEDLGFTLEPCESVARRPRSRRAGSSSRHRD